MGKSLVPSKHCTEMMCELVLVYQREAIGHRRRRKGVLGRGEVQAGELRGKLQKEARPDQQDSPCLLLLTDRATGSAGTR